MKKVIGIVSAFLLSLVFAVSSSVFADAKAGEKLYKHKGCSACHHPTKDQLAMGKGPSYQMVSAAYKKAGGKAALVKFLEGKGDPIVAPAKFSIMKGQLRNIKRWKDQQRSDIADFILTH